MTKSFRRRTIVAQHSTLKSELVRMFSRRKRPGPQRAEFFEVLRGVDLEIRTGETVGIIGRNGSGKSTLLKLMTGIYGPTSGAIQSHGRISALLELGAGFHPDFSGRENVFVNGIILGLSRSEIRARLEEIIAFAELGEFIDEPVRTYSSGMFMRLAFAVATHVDPEILIIDEILAVGDDHFARKSMAKMTEFKKRGKTIVLVTHDLGTVQRWCDRAVWIHQGRVREVGNPADVVSAYRREVAEAEFAAQEPASPPATPVEPSREQAAPEPRLPEVRLPEPLEGPRVGPERRWGNFRLELPRVRLLDLRGGEAHVLDTEDGVVLEMEWVAREPIEDVVFGISIEQAGTGLQAYGTNTLIDGVRPSTPLIGRGKVSLQIDRLGLVSGDYLVDVAAHTRDNTNYDYQRQLLRFAVRSSITDVGVTRPPHRWSIEVQQGGKQ